MDIKLKIDEINNIVNQGKTEKRKLTDTEYNKIISLKNEVVELRKVEEDKIKNNNKNMEKFSLLKSIRDVVENRTQSEETIAVVNAGRKLFEGTGISARGQIVLPMEYEKRVDIVASDYNNAGLYLGQEIVATDKLNLIGALRANSVVFAAGANLLTGLVGNISIPVYAGTSSLWAYETSGATDGAGAFSEVNLAPKRLTTYIDISKQFLLQDSVSAEQLLYSDLSQSIMDKLEASILDAVAVSQTRPAGMFNGVSYTTSGTTTWANFVALESAVNGSNALKGSLAYLVHPTTLGVLKTTAKASNAAIFIADGNSANGYPVLASSNLPTISGAAKGCIFGNFQDLIVANWGSIDITVDPYSQSINGKVRLVVNSYWDFAKRRTASFAYGALA